MHWAKGLCEQQCLMLVLKEVNRVSLKETQGQDGPKSDGFSLKEQVPSIPKPGFRNLQEILACRPKSLARRVRSQHIQSLD